MNKLLHQYTTYNLWANRRIKDMIGPLSEVQMSEKIISSFPSVRKTLLHIWDAETIWLARLQSVSMDYWPSDKFEGNKADLFEGLLSISEKFCQYTDQLTDAESSYTFKNTKGNSYTMIKGETIHHCMNHSTFHRGQLITILRQLGQENLVSTDFITYLRELQEV